MSKFTTEVRYICQNYAKSDDESIDEMINDAIPFIFNDWWNAGDEEHTLELKKKILRHYYTQEIGYETVGLWKLHLNQTLAEIMPKYNVLYSNLNNVKAKLFETADWYETSDGSYDTHNESSSDSNSTSDGTSSSHSTDTSESGQESSSKNDSKSNATATAWQKYNDTPQGALTGIDNDTYLTNATKNISESNSTGNTAASTTANAKNSDTSDSTSQTHDTSKNGSTSTSDGTQKNQNTRHVAGKNSGGDYLSQYLNLQNQYNDIDQMVIKDLQPLFMGLWE